MRFFKPWLCLVLLASLQVQLTAQEVDRLEWLTAGATMGLGLTLEAYGDSQDLSSRPPSGAPNAFDARMRDQLWWGESQQTARRLSDVLIYGVSMSSLVWGPLATDRPERNFYINLQVFAANHLLTNLAKILVSRERPYHYYDTRPSEANNDYRSFYSGHASVAFSQAVTNAMLLSTAHPDQQELIWSSLLGLAGLTAYLRVAGDMHYFSDIFVGAAMGSLIGWTTTHFLERRLDSEASGTEVTSFGIGPGGSSNILFMIKIPLG